MSLKRDRREPEVEAGNCPEASIAHVCPSRVRLSFLAEKGSREFFEALCDELVQLAMVRRVEARPLTGSVIIVHEGPMEDLLRAADERGQFKLRDEPESDMPQKEAQSLQSVFGSMLESLSGSGISLRSLAAMAFLAMAIRQIAAGNIMPPATTALWYGFSLLLLGNPFSTSGGEDGGD